MKIVISSHIRSDIARNHLLESLRQYNEFINYEYIIVIGGYYDIPNYDISVEDNITYIKANHNSIDITGLIALAELYSNDINEYYLYLHDTCKVGPHFFEKLSTIQLDNVSSIHLTDYPSMNLGIYSQKLINLNKDILTERKCIKDEDRSLFKYKAIEEEDMIFKNDPNTKTLDGDCNRVITGPTDYYKTGTMRIVEYYSNLDLYKIKANWGQGGCNLNN
jgi:hypothetical protein